MSKREFDERIQAGWIGRYTQMSESLGFGDDSLTTRALLAGYASPLGRPWLNRDIAQSLAPFQRAIEVAHLPYYEAVERLDTNVESFTPYARIMNTAPIRNMRSQARMEVQLQLLQIGLTLERRQADTGELPNTLAALSADFPEKTLIDPFTGERFIYRPDNGSFLLYSAGRNQADDGGRHDPIRGDIVWRHD